MIFPPHKGHFPLKAGEMMWTTNSDISEFSKGQNKLRKCMNYPAKFIGFTHIHTKLVCFPGMTRRVISYKKAITYRDGLLLINLFHRGIPPFSEPPQPPNLRLKVAPSNPFLLLQVWFLLIPCFFMRVAHLGLKRGRSFRKLPPTRTFASAGF